MERRVRIMLIPLIVALVASLAAVHGENDTEACSDDITEQSFTNVEQCKKIGHCEYGCQGNRLDKNGNKFCCAKFPLKCKTDEDCDVSPRRCTEGKAKCNAQQCECQAPLCTKKTLDQCKRVCPKREKGQKGRGVGSCATGGVLEDPNCADCTSDADCCRKGDTCLGGHCYIACVAGAYPKCNNSRNACRTSTAGGRGCAQGCLPQGAPCTSSPECCFTCGFDNKCTGPPSNEKMCTGDAECKSDGAVCCRNYKCYYDKKQC